MRTPLILDLWRSALHALERGEKDERDGAEESGREGKGRQGARPLGTLGVTRWLDREGGPGSG